MLGANERRLILGYQKRNLSDLLFAKITSWIAGRNGDFWFALTCSHSRARIGDLDTLSGFVCIYKSKANWNRSKGQAATGISRLASLGMMYDINREIDDLHLRISALFEVECDIKIYFRLSRDGEVRFSSPVFKDPILGINSEKYARRRGVSFTKWTADQAYFFIRDLCHVHQHHDPKVDTILILQDGNLNEATWRNHISFSLHHYVIKMRRTEHTVDLYRGLGVLAYAKAFEGISINRNANGSARSLAHYQYGAIEASLNAKINSNTAKKREDDSVDSQSSAESIGYRTIYFTIYLGILAIVIAILQPYIEEHKKEVSALAEYLVQNAWGILVTTACLILVTIFFTRKAHFRRSHLFKHNILYVKDFAAVSLIHRKLIGVISTLISIAIVLIATVTLFMSR